MSTQTTVKSNQQRIYVYEMKKKPTNDYVFCDSLIALRNAYELGLPLNAVVLTRSPSILRALPINAISLDDRANINPKKTNEFFFETSSSILHLKQLLDNYPHLSPFSILVSREVWNWQQHTLFSIFIRENDYVDQRFFVRPDFGDDALNKRFGFDWSQFFVGAKNFKKYYHSKSLTNSATKGGTISYTDIILSRDNHFFGRLLDGISNKFSRRIARGTVHYLRSSELVRDINIELFLRLAAEANHSTYTTVQRKIASNYKRN